MHVTLNGEETPVSAGTTLADLVGSASGRAAAVNGVVVPRDQHPRTRLADGDVVEIVTAVQGG
jgi:sulfur carrier protein